MEDFFINYQDLINNVNSTYKYPTTFNKNDHINMNPHYSDTRFKEQQAVFGQETKKINYVYSDRLQEWDYDKHKQAVEAANKSNKSDNTCFWYEEYLSFYYGKKTEILHIISGVNPSNGYAYNVFGYKHI